MLTKYRPLLHSKAILHMAFVSALASLLMGASTTMCSELEYRWAELCQLKVGRHLFTAAWIGQSKLLVVGGLVGGRGQLAGEVTNLCEVVDAELQEAYYVAPMNDARAEHSMLIHPEDSTLYVIAGLAAGGGVNTSIERYDKQRNRWYTIGHLLTGRRQQVAYWISPTEILVVGGRSSDLSTMGVAEVFDVQTGISRPVESYPEQMSTAAVAVADSYSGIVMGGRAGGPNSERSHLAYRYDRVRDAWLVEGTRTESAARPTTMTTWDGKFVVTGGALAESPFTPSAGVWYGSTFSSARSGIMQHGRQWHSIAQVSRSLLIAGGGFTEDARIVRSCDWIDMDNASVYPGPELNVARSYCEFISVPTAYATNGEISSATVICVAGLGSNGLNTPVVEILEQLACKDEAPQDVDLSLVGSTALTDNGIRLTSATAFERSAVWYRQMIDVTKGFRTYVAMQLSDGTDSNQRDGYDPGADGFAIVLQNQSTAAVGDAGQGIGYAGIRGRLAVEFDAYKNVSFYDPNGSHLSIQKPVFGVLTGAHTPDYEVAHTVDIPPLVADGTVYHCWVEYDGTILTVWMSTDGQKGAPRLTVPMSLGTAPGWLGITSSTGFARQAHIIRTWSIGSCGDPIPTLIHQQSESRELRLSPVPASTTVSIALPDAWTGNASTVSLMAADGRMVRTVALPAGTTASEITVDDLPPGLYGIRVTCGDDVLYRLLPILR